MEKAMWLILGVMLCALTLLLRAERRAAQTGLSGTDVDGPVRRGPVACPCLGGEGDGQQGFDRRGAGRARRVGTAGLVVGPVVQGGGWSAVLFVLLVLVPLALVFLAPVPPTEGAALLEYIAAHKVVYLTELVCFVGLAVPALVVFSAVAVALKDVNKSVAAIGGLFGIASEVIALALGSSPQSCTAAWSCSATPTRPPVGTPNGPGWSARPKRSSLPPTPSPGRGY